MAGSVTDLSSREHLAGAFDSISGVYDAHVPDDTWMRTELRRHALSAFRPGGRVLDVGSGTGTEALFLARHGFRIDAVDVSPGMIVEARRKVSAAGLDAAIRLEVADLRDLEHWPAGEFDAVLSTYAVLNMVDSLAAFSEAAARLLRPGGRMLLHLHGGTSLLECLRAVLRGRPGGFRFLGRGSTRPFTISGRHMLLHTFPPEETYQRFFEREFDLTNVYALGVIRPDAHPRGLPWPGLRGLELIERSVRARRPFVAWGRFFVLDLTKRG